MSLDLRSNRLGDRGVSALAVKQKWRKILILSRCVCLCAVESYYLHVLSTIARTVAKFDAARSRKKKKKTTRNAVRQSSQSISVCIFVRPLLGGLQDLQANRLTDAACKDIANVFERFCVCCKPRDVISIVIVDPSRINFAINQCINNRRSGDERDERRGAAAH